MGKNTQDTGIFKAILEGVNEAVLTIGIDGTLLSTNPSGKQIFGLTSDHLGKKFHSMDLFDEDTNARLTEMFTERITKDSAVTKDFKATFKNGEVKWLRIDSTLIRDQNGTVTGLATIIDDITERKRYEQALITSESRFRTVVESLHEGLGITDENENMVYANDSLSSLMGYTKEELLNMNISQVVSKEEFINISNKSQKRKTGRSEIYESQIIGKDGAVRDVLISAAPWVDDEGNYQGSIGLLLDITERKSVEKALRENEEKYRATVEQSAENVYIYDIETKKIVESNPTLQELLGYSADEMVELTPSDFIAHTSKNIGSQIDKVIQKGKAIIGERTYIRKDGSLVEVEVSAGHIRYGNRSMLCVVSRDITEKKRSREQIIEERNRAEFYLDLLAHDIGNLHHGILTGVDMVNMSGNDPDRRERSMKLVRDLVLRSIKLVDNVMTFSSLRSMRLQKIPIDLRTILDKALISAKDALPEKELEHSMKWVGEEVEIMAEPLLQEAFFNLYHNGLKYQKGNNATMETHVEMSEKGVVGVRITDFGPGIPDDRKNTIFDRMKDPLKRQHTGLGMAIVKVLIERYDGKITITSRVPGDFRQGTNFLIEIPLS